MVQTVKNSNLNRLSGKLGFRKTDPVIIRSVIIAAPHETVDEVLVTDKWMKQRKAVERTRRRMKASEAQ